MIAADAIHRNGTLRTDDKTNQFGRLAGLPAPQNRKSVNCGRERRLGA
jgi:hypothetical protein